jgi:hypothetical protein
MSSNDDGGGGAAMASSNSSPPGATTVVHADATLVDGMPFDVTRTRLLTSRIGHPRDIGRGGDARGDDDDGGGGGGCVVYWMIRDVRASDNWALLFASFLAAKGNVPLRVVYALPPPPPSSSSTTRALEDGNDDRLHRPPPKPSDLPYTQRHGKFLLEGLRFVSTELSKLGVPFDVLRPTSCDAVGEAISSYCGVGDHGGQNAIACVCDMSPLRHHREWTEGQAADLLEDAGLPLYQVRREELGGKKMRSLPYVVTVKVCHSDGLFDDGFSSFRVN